MYIQIFNSMAREQTLIDLWDARTIVSRQLDVVREEANRLEKALAGLDSSIEFFQDENNTPSEKELGRLRLVNRSIQVMDPTSAVLELFESNPMKEFTNAEIGQHLERLRLRGDLRTTNTKIAKQCNYIPKRLLDKGKIENVGRPHKPRWKLKT